LAAAAAAIAVTDPSRFPVIACFTGEAPLRASPFFWRENGRTFLMPVVFTFAISP
jgi:hypothetical protein